MSKSKTIRCFSALSLTGLLLFSACGSGQDLGAGYSTDLSAALNSQASLPSSVSSARDQEVADAIPKILQGLQDIKEEIQALDGRAYVPSGGGSAAPAPMSASGGGRAPAPRPQAPSTSGAPRPPAAAPSQPQQPSAQERGEAELAALMNTLKSSPFVALTASKIEKNLDSGKVTSNRIKMWSKLPNVVKIDILESTSGSAGVKALYNSGQGAKIKVRPSGALGFVTVDLDKTDDRVASNNGYLSDDIDLFGVQKRLSQGYAAELVGTSKFEGATINILKLKAQGTNSLDARIDYEYLGYEPDSYKVRLWEVYSQGEQQPFYRMSIHEIDYPASLADSIFKL